MYGLVKREHLKDMAEAVCDALGHGENRKAVNLILETAVAETGAGLVKDTTVGAGMGITQIDKMPFYDIKDRCNKADKMALKIFLNVDIDLVEWEHLRYNPFLCLIFTRLKYKKIPEKIPSKLEDRSDYWKKYYNTIAGKGTTKHYIDENLIVGLV